MGHGSRSVTPARPHRACAPSPDDRRETALLRRQVLTSGLRGALATGAAYALGMGASRSALASTPSPMGFTHAEAEQGDVFYDFGSQNLFQSASLSDIPELIEFMDTGEQDSLALAEAGPENVALPAPRPNIGGSSTQSLTTDIPLPLARQNGSIPEKLDFEETDPLSNPALVLAARSPDLRAGNRQVTAPSDALNRRLGRNNRTLNIHAINLSERLNINYFRDGQYDTGALAELDNLFRDRHAQRSAAIDPGVYDQLFAASNIFQGREISMLSGYRARSTNEAMRRRMAGVAKFSYHVKGQAVDFYIHGISISDLHVAALKLTAGGVGYYPGSNFVHIDTGPVRNWPNRYAYLGYRYRQS